jgi:hypothetical protein
MQHLNALGRDDDLIALFEIPLAGDAEDSEEDSAQEYELDERLAKDFFHGVNSWQSR